MDKLTNTTEPQIAYSECYRLPFLSLFHADCMEIMKQYPDKHFDLAIVDPPYGIERFKTANEETTGVYAKRGSWKHEGAKNWNNEKPTDEYFEQLFRVSKYQIIWGANNFNLPPSEYFLVWDKVQYMPNFASAEYAWVCMGLKKPAKVFRYTIHKENAERKMNGGKIHPTQKPTPLYSFVLQNYATNGMKLLDTHFGSGSIALAVDKANRLDKMNLHLTACEIDKEYIDKAIKRISESIKQGTLSF